MAVTLVGLDPYMAAILIEAQGLDGVWIQMKGGSPEAFTGCTVNPGDTLHTVLRRWCKKHDATFLADVEIVDEVFGNDGGPVQ